MYAVIFRATLLQMERTLNRIRWIAVLLGSVTLVACRSARTPDSDILSADATLAPARAALDSSSAGSSDSPAEKLAKVTADDLLIRDPASLNALNEFDLGFVLDGTHAANNSELTGDRYASIVSTIAEDTEWTKKGDPASGVGMAYAHRLFDSKYLRSADAKWELTGISQRIDRMFSDPSRCGELRFLYRLRYDSIVKGVAISSRLPATLAVTFWNAESGGSACPTVAAAWAKRDRIALARERFKAVEMNIQIERWPSTVRGDLAGHAEYALRALVPSPNGKGLIAGPLENTPNVERARTDAAFRAKMLEWMKQNEALLMRGMPILPAEFLATRAVSVTPLGGGRLQNRPFSAIFQGESVAANGDATREIARRWDQLSCQGCHETRSVAGFHFLGDETAPKESVNAILVGRSPHLLRQLRFRVDQFENIHRGANSIAQLLPIPSADPEDAVRGGHCALGSNTCPAGLTCQPDATTKQTGLGACLSPTPRLGDPCEVGTLSTDIDRARDRVSGMKARSCPGVCESNQVGFPGGACAGSCDALQPGDVCGAIPFLVGFNNCIGHAGVSFEDCIRNNSRPAAVMGCSDTTPCRDDYICARTPNGEGACMPPYFLFQMRVDGHP